MKKLGWLVLPFLPLSMAACNMKPNAGCSDDNSKTLVAKIVSDEAEKEVVASNNDGSNIFEPAKVRATLAQIKMSVEDIRTTKSDPNSTKKFCAGTLKITVPVEMLNATEKARELAGVNKIAQFAQQNGFEANSNTFSKEIEYSVQPTDDGKNIYAELEAAKPLAHFESELVQSALLMPVLENRKAQQEAEAKQQALEMQRQGDEQSKANLEQAKADNNLANQTINELWKSLPDSTRQTLLEQQRAWIKKKEIDCKLDAASKSTDPTVKETARLTCDTNQTVSRINTLKQFLHQ
jgi:uncharacterized protein YecT (DUF1311 family)